MRPYTWEGQSQLEAGPDLFPTFLGRTRFLGRVLREKEGATGELAPTATTDGGRARCRTLRQDLSHLLSFVGTFGSLDPSLRSGRLTLSPPEPVQ